MNLFGGRYSPKHFVLEQDIQVLSSSNSKIHMTVGGHLHLKTTCPVDGFEFVGPLEGPSPFLGTHFQTCPSNLLGSINVPTSLVMEVLVAQISILVRVVLVNLFGWQVARYMIFPSR
jgi:hypothetical protein